MKLTIDFETRSECNLVACGSYIYSVHPSTEVFCLAIKKDDNPTVIWVNPKFLKRMLLWNSMKVKSLPLISNNHAQTLVKKADIIEAHNVEFDKNIYENVMCKKYNWLSINTLWQCSAAKSARWGLPRSLEKAGDALGLSIQKDKTGFWIMRKLCKPRKPTKNNPSLWHEDSKDIYTLCKYCIVDVESEYSLSTILPELSAKEKNIWETQLDINNRGFYVDVEAATEAIKIIEHSKEIQLEEFKKITEEKVSSPTQRDRMFLWLAEQGFPLPDLTAKTVADALAHDLPPSLRYIHRALVIRQNLSRSSTAKFTHMVNGSDTDQRVRGAVLYYGAPATGRFSGRLIQPHNMPREVPQNASLLFDILTDNQYNTLSKLQLIELFFGDVNEALSKAIRPFIRATPGYELLYADYSSIEGRILAWVAQEKKILKNYRDKKDAYCVFASRLFNTPYEEILKGYKNGIQKYINLRYEGKIGELACGYQGGEQAVRSYASDMPLKQRQKIVNVWREYRPKTVQFWYDIEKCARRAIKDPGKIFKCGPIAYKVKNNILYCLLPSGRTLLYREPRLEHKQTPWGEPKLAIIYRRASNYTESILYGGKQTENIVQGIARDILTEALLRVKQAGYNIVLHVHDEIICETIKGKGDIKTLCKLLCADLPWLKGCPMAADGAISKRYKLE